VASSYKRKLPPTERHLANRQERRDFGSNIERRIPLTRELALGRLSARRRPEQGDIPHSRRARSCSGFAPVLLVVVVINIGLAGVCVHLDARLL
jgi:hypothetical protein